MLLALAEGGLKMGTGPHLFPFSSGFAMQIPPLVSPQWLHDNLENPSVQIIENAWLQDSYFKAHIPGACHVPVHPYLKRFDDAGQRTQHVMAVDEFSALCHHLGLSSDRHYIVYDDYFGLFAARFRWVCCYYGLTNVSILDGSWRGWIEQDLPVSSRVEAPISGSDIDMTCQSSLLIGLEELLQVYQDPQIQLWDTRRPAEFSGRERTENLRQGHIPGALNLDWSELLCEAPCEGGARYFKPVAELEAMLSRLGLSRGKTIVTYCQSGNRATIGNLVLDLLGYSGHRLYDASMGEWGNLATTPLVIESEK
jgi:thiosulfate/3-mercaptopyruvate sulfurtransferase